MDPAIVIAGALALLGGGAGLYAYARDNGWIGTPAPASSSTATPLDSAALTDLNLNATSSVVGGTISPAEGAYEAGVAFDNTIAATNAAAAYVAAESAAAAAEGAAAQASRMQATQPAPSFSLGVI